MVNKKKTRKLNIFYPDGANSGGVPSDIRDLFFAIPKENQGNLYTIHKRTNVKSNIKCLTPIKFIMGVIKDRTSLKNDINVIVGGTVPFNIVIYLAFRIMSISYNFMPLSHFASYSMKTKLFSHLPIIEKIDSKSDKKIRKTYMHSLKKRVHFFLFGRKFLMNSYGVLVSSNFEKEELLNAIPALSNKKFYNYSYGCNTLIGRTSSYKFEEFKDNINIVFWGRVDFFNKGLDRLINGISVNPTCFRNKNVIFHILGPSYNQGKVILRNIVGKKNLGDLFNIPDDQSVKKIDFGGLINSDGVIFLTRWEGYPRVLRECLMLGVPFLSTAESNFIDKTKGDKFSKFAFYSEYPDSPSILLKDLCFFIDSILENKMRQEKIHGERLLDWENIGRNFIEQFN